jgi:hypothetical protein
MHLDVEHRAPAMPVWVFWEPSGKIMEGANAYVKLRFRETETASGCDEKACFMLFVFSALRVRDPYLSSPPTSKLATQTKHLIGLLPVGAIAQERSELFVSTSEMIIRTVPATRMQTGPSDGLVRFMIGC